MATIRGRGINWSEEECKCLISIWNDDLVMNMMCGTSRDRVVYNMISEKLAGFGYERSPDQCRRKMKQMKNEYKKVQDNNRTSGKGRISCLFFNEMHSIFGSRPALNPDESFVIDTANASPPNVEEVDCENTDGVYTDTVIYESVSVDTSDSRRPLKKRRLEETDTVTNNKTVPENNANKDSDGQRVETVEQRQVPENNGNIVRDEQRTKIGVELRREVRLKKRTEKDSKMQKIIDKCMEKHLLHEQKREKKDDEFDKKFEERESRREAQNLENVQRAQQDRKIMIELQQQKMAFDREQLEFHRQQQELNRQHELQMFRMMVEILKPNHPPTSTSSGPPNNRPQTPTTYRHPPLHMNSQSEVYNHHSDSFDPSIVSNSINVLNQY